MRRSTSTSKPNPRGIQERHTINLSDVEETRTAVHHKRRHRRRIERRCRDRFHEIVARAGGAHRQRNGRARLEQAAQRVMHRAVAPHHHEHPCTAGHRVPRQRRLHARRARIESHDLLHAGHRIERLRERPRERRGGLRGAPSTGGRVHEQRDHRRGLACTGTQLGV
jgi:hypothetical protein